MSWKNYFQINPECDAPDEICSSFASEADGSGTSEPGVDGLSCEDINKGLFCSDPNFLGTLNSWVSGLLCWNEDQDSRIENNESNIINNESRLDDLENPIPVGFSCSERYKTANNETVIADKSWFFNDMPFILNASSSTNGQILSPDFSALTNIFPCITHANVEFLFRNTGASANAQISLLVSGGATNQVVNIRPDSDQNSNFVFMGVNDDIRVDLGTASSVNISLRVHTAHIMETV